MPLRDSRYARSVETPQDKQTQKEDLELVKASEYIIPHASKDEPVEHIV